MHIALVLSLLFPFSVLCTSAIASDEGNAPSGDADLSLESLGADEWHVKLQPYVWIPARVDGTSTVSGSVANLDLSFSDVIDHFDEIFVLSGRVEAWHGDWGIIFDGMYVNLESDFSLDPFGGGARELDVHMHIRQAIVDFGLGWRVIDQPIAEADPNGPRFQLDLVGGGRYQYLKQEIDLSPTDLGTSKDWLEILVGGRATLQLNETISLAVRGDASGFGIGSASELTWNFYGGTSLNLSPGFDLILGYRILDMDYDNGSGEDEFGLDARMHGPYIGGAFSF